MTSEKDSGVNGEPFPSRDETVRMGEDRLAQHHDDAVQATTFKPGQLVGERYLILRLVATGGMGEVYEADDLDLSERVALKTLKAEAYPSEVTQKRFRREIQLARKVTHPNVCRVHDVFTHVVRSPDRREMDELACVTMEFLEGETLSRKLEREGALPLEEAIDTVRQMADGLAAAHDAGIIHRDFKPGNVILVPQPDGGTRAVITDFGLARKVETDVDPTLTETGMVVGTPAYIPPEQLEGKFITTAADIYALGVVIYEMVTGKRPFPGNTPISLVVQRLQTLPISPAKHLAGLDRSWEKTILRCLEAHPEARFGSARDVVASLEQKKVPRGRGPRRNKTVRRERLERAGLVVLIVAALLAGVGGVRTLLGRGTRDAVVTEATSDPVESRRAAAVFGLRNLSGNQESAWLSTALGEMLRTEMAAGEKIRLVSGEDTERATIELGLSDIDSFSGETLQRLRSNLGAEIVVVGSYLVRPHEGGADLRVELRLRDTSTGKTVLAVERTGEREQLLKLVAELGEQLRSQLGTSALTADQTRELEAARPSSQEALRLYSLGLEALRTHDVLGAKGFMESAIEFDTEFPLAHAALADVWATLGYDEKAREEAEAAFALSESLDRETRLLVEGRLYESARDWQKAIAAYETLFSFYPDNLEYGLRLANAETSAGNGVNAAKTIARMRSLPSPLSADPRIDLAEAAAAEFRGDFGLELEAADKAIGRAKDSGAKLLEAAGLVRRALALRELSELGLAADSIVEAERRYRSVGDRGNGARATYVLATIRDTEGRFEESEKLYRDALGVAREIGWKSLETLVLNSLTTTLYAQGRLSSATKVLKEALVLAEETGNRRHVAARHVNLGHIAYLRGELEESEEELDLAEALAREIGDEHSTQVIRMLKGFVAFHRANLGLSQSLEEESSRVFAKESNSRVGAYAEETLGKCLFYRGNVKAARQHLELSTRMRVAANEAFTEGRSRLVLAMFDLDEEKWDTAAAGALDTSARFREQKARDFLMLSQLVLARAEAERERPEKALAALAEADRIARVSESPLSRLAWVGRSAEVRARLGLPVDMVQIDRAIDECRKRGLKLLELDLRAAQSRLRGEDPAEVMSEVSGIERLPLIP